MTILPLTGGPNPFNGLREAVERGDFVALVSDRDLTSNGVEVDFFGHRARMAKGPALLALLTGAPLYAASIHFAPAAPGRGAAGRETVVTFSNEIPVPTEGTPAAKAQAMTQACAAYVEGPIREHTSGLAHDAAGFSSTTSTRPVWGGDQGADRHRLLLVRHPRRGAVPRARPGRDPALTRSHRVGARPRRRGHRTTPTTSSRPGAPCR